MSPWALYPAFIACVAVSTCIQNLTGFAFGLILLGLVSTFDLASVADAGNAATALTLVNAFAYFRVHKLQPGWRVVRPAMLPSLAGVAVGVLLLMWLSENAVHLLRGMLGLAILACAVALLIDAKPRTTLSAPGAFAFVGSLSGLMGGLFSSAGPPLVYHMYRQPLPRDLVRQCLILMFAVNQVLRLLLVLGSGRFTWHSVWLSLAAVPAVYVVTRLQHRYMPPIGMRLTKCISSGLLILAGGSLVTSFIRSALR
ncbi:TSUP family transporter [soil metagenome]